MSAIILAAKLDCSAVKRQSWLSTTSATASRFSSMTMRMPSTIGFVAQIGDAFDLLFAHEFGDLLDQRGLVHLIRNLGDDERLALLADFLDLDLGAHEDRAAAR